MMHKCDICFECKLLPTGLLAHYVFPIPDCPGNSNSQGDQVDNEQANDGDELDQEVQEFWERELWERDWERHSIVDVINFINI